jgi:hypothetical protein
MAMMALDGGRIGIGSRAIGIGTAALEAAIAYAQNRKQFNRPIAAARLLTLRAAFLKERGVPAFSREAAIAKVFASETGWRVCPLLIGCPPGTVPITHDAAPVRLCQPLCPHESSRRRLVPARHPMLIRPERRGRGSGPALEVFAAGFFTAAVLAD